MRGCLFRRTAVERCKKRHPNNQFCKIVKLRNSAACDISNQNHNRGIRTGGMAAATDGCSVF
ncbi:hypothetical protein DW965_14565 [Blautia sp. AM47-4]|nr:hypothetical protein DW965_14565 [Blautia sp. AM47-4]